MAKSIINRSLLIAASSLSLCQPSLAAAKKLSTDRADIDGHMYTVIRYDNNTVKVVEASMFGKAPGLALRDAMRRAVVQATGCTTTDDFFVDAKLMGTLTCPDVVTATGRR